MTIEFAIISIIAATLLMILSMSIRAKNRANTQYHIISFCYEEDCWRVVIRMARFWWILYTQVKAVSSDQMSFRPQAAYTLRKNGRVIIALPNFWADNVGVSVCKVSKDDTLTMQVEIAFKNVAMARAFVETLSKQGYHTKIRHNMVTFEALSPKNHNCDN